MCHFHSLGSLCVHLGLFFKAGWSKRADPFNLRSCSVVTAVDGAVKHESGTGRGGCWAGAPRAAELKREEKDLLSSYKVATLL